MPDDPILSPAKGAEAIASASRYIYQAILATHHQHPEWLKESFRNNPWHSDKFQNKFTLKLVEKLQQSENSEALLRKTLKILQFVMEPGFFASSDFSALMHDIRNLMPSGDGSAIARVSVAKTSAPAIEEFALNGGTSQKTPAASTFSNGTSPASSKEAGIAILLLDAENLYLDEETEDFLKNVCQYEIQIKVAFANWQRMGKKDVELHNLHYELIHVPAGKDSADVKMATVGSSIFVHYPTAKEVLVCSSDEVMSHLCTTLQTHGLTVYRVRKHGKTVTVFNTQTGKTQTHVLGSLPDIPPLDRFISQLKDIIKYEQAKTNQTWIKLSSVSESYQKKHQRTLTEVVAFHSPGTKVSDFFLQSQADFVLYQPPDRAHFYITLFEIPHLPPTQEIAASVLQPAVKSQGKPGINSAGDLEEALIAILQDLTAKYPETPITMDILGSSFSLIHGEGITKTLSRLKVGIKFPIFLQACGSFHLTPHGRTYLVALREEGSESAIVPASSSEIKSLPDLEQALVNILKEITLYAPGSYIALGVLGTEFRNRYGKPINTVIKEQLKLNSNFISLIQYLTSFKVKQTAKGWEVAIAPAAPSSRAAKL